MAAMQSHATPPAFLDKICPRADLPQALQALPRPWVFTIGVFDVLPRGHVVYLAQARALGSLIVALNTDASVRRLGKGGLAVEYDGPRHRYGTSSGESGDLV